MKYQTIGNSSPVGKPKVYFTCHRADFDRYFEKITGMLHAQQDCAVFYDPDPDQPEFAESFRSDLLDMQLIVIPITHRFLMDGCRARLEVLPYAQKEHITVLPILEDSRLSSKFNDICGALHYLNPNDHDETALPFETKLATFLESVLLGDKTIQKVRSIFRKSIFLSYRKIDRFHARELMRIIHNSERFWDVSIWYDEYLVPGEDFNEKIQEAMSRSRLMALVVTPNLVVEGNYVMKHEFPDAYDAGMKILPVEMQVTAHDVLKKHFTGIPPCSDPRDKASLYDRLADMLETTSQMSDDPAYQYYIGLAYLNGIDMEVDRKRALKLITSSADAEYPNAMKMLVRMYERGIGVACSLEKAIAWQNKIIRLYNTALFNKQSASILIEEMYNKAGLLSDFGRVKEAIQTYGEILAKLTAYFRDSRSEESVMLAVRLYQELTNMNRKIHSLDEAKAYAEKSLAIIQAETAHYPALKKYYARILHQMGMIAFTENDNEAAQEYFKQAASVFEELWLQGDTTANRSDLAWAFDNLGTACAKLGRMEEAEHYYQECVRLSEITAEITKTDNAHFMVAAVYMNMSISVDLQNSVTYLDKAIAICEESINKTDDEAWKSLYAACLTNKFNWVKKHKSEEEALPYGEKATAIFAKLMEETDVQDYKRHYETLINQLVYILWTRGEEKKAKAYSSTVIEIEQSRVRHDHSERELFTAFVNLLLSANFSMQAKAYDEVLRIYQQVREMMTWKQFCKESIPLEQYIQIYRDLAEIAFVGHAYKEECVYREMYSVLAYKQVMTTGSEDAIDTYLQCLYDLGSAYLQSGQLRAAMTVYQEHFEAADEADEAMRDTPMIQQHLFNGLYEIGKLYFTKGEAEIAVRYLNNALKNAELLAASGDTQRSMLNLIECYSLLSEALFELNDQEAFVYQQKSLDMADMLAANDPSDQNLSQLAICHSKMGNLYLLQEDAARAEPHYLRARELREQLLEKYPDESAQRFYAISCNKLGDICRMRGKDGKALLYYQQGMAINEELVEKSPITLNQDALAVSYYNVGAACEERTEMIRYLKKSLEIWQNLAAHNPDVARFQQMAQRIISILPRP